MESSPVERRGELGDVPLACVAEAIPEGERAAHFALIARLFGERPRQKAALADGYEYQFDDEDFRDIARFVENERRCCPFLTFSIEVTPDSGVRLRLLGPPRTREFLDMELSG
jgi:hypothetical protein